MRTYGTASLIDGQTWRLQMEPHVALRFKRIFPQVEKKRTGALLLSASEDNCRDLEWFLERYPLEFDPKAAAWLRELIERGHIATGTVDERSIEDIRPDELCGFTQCHFFGGGGRSEGMIHAELVQVAARWLRNTRRCSVVLTERGIWEIADAIGWTSHPARCVLIEVKVSRSDFRADAKKPHRVHPGALGRERWYLTPVGLVLPEEIQQPWGLLAWTGKSCRVLARPDVLPQDLASAEHERRLVLSELRNYQAQGITYKVGAERWAPVKD